MLEMRHSARHQKSLIGLTYLSFTGLAALHDSGKVAAGDKNIARTMQRVRPWR
jgi:hypothetical protein